MTFLDHIAQSFQKIKLPDLYRYCLVFPTQRSCYQFHQLLKNRLEKESFIFPEIVTIQNFIRRFAIDAVVDEFTLLCELYPLHEALTHAQQSFDKFIPWGQQILKDFDEIDKYLVNAAQLFSALSAQKQLEEDFDLSEAMRPYLNDFLNTLDERRNGIYQQEFLKTWKVLGALYPQFQMTLRKKRMSYEGMVYREVTERLGAGDLTLPYEQIHFCGFNAFSYCEEKLVQILSGQYHVETWWDADEQFMENSFHEAGNFLRRYQSMFSGERHHWITEALPREEKNITITAIASNIGQAAYAAQKPATTETGNSCIVLCDEQLLTPLLSYLPFSEINITMGFPVVHATAYMIVSHLLNLHRNARNHENSCVFYYKDILTLADDPHLSGYFSDVAALKTTVAYSVPYISLNALLKFCREPLLADVLQAKVDIPALLERIIHLLQAVSSADPYFDLPRNLIVKGLLALKQQIAESGLEIAIPGLCRIIPFYFASARIPFDSKLESPVQIMGFLETRLQDFDNVTILSLNDDILPGTNRTNTFIPYNIRRSFGLPTFEQFDGINAYHFYRLLKRARNIELVYNNAVTDNASERSRFIRQIAYEWNHERHPIKIQRLNADAELVHNVAQSISIPKTDPIKNALRKMAFSPSSLKLYLTCPLQFYLKYIAKISEPEELQSDPDAAQFGNVLHNTMELFYADFVEMKIDGALIKKRLQEKSFSEILDAGAEKAGIAKSLFHGKNKLQWRILERIGLAILESDAAGEPFRLLGTETEMRYEKLKLNDGSFAMLKGKIDRIDQLEDGSIRILDYKTGKVELARFPKDDSKKELDKFFDTIFLRKSTDHSITLQGMIYTLLYTQTRPDSVIRMGFYKARDLNSGILYLNDGDSIPGWLLAEFEIRLGKLLSEIIYEKVAFDRHTDENAYAQSAYGDLLGII